MQGGSSGALYNAPGGVTKAVRHKTVEEIWYALSGEGEDKRKLGDEEFVVSLLLRQASLYQ